MDVGAWAQAGFASAAFLFGARALYNYANNTPEPEGCSYLPWPGNSITSSTVIPVPQITSLTAGGHAEGRSSSASGSSRGVGGASAQGGGAAAAAAASGGGGGGGISSGGSGGGGFGSGELITAADIVVVDCTHPLLPTLSHHKGARNPAVVKADDTSTGLCYVWEGARLRVVVVECGCVWVLVSSVESTCHLSKRCSGAPEAEAASPCVCESICVPL